MKIQNNEKQPLRLHAYIDKHNRVYYIAHFNGQFRFVHNVLSATGSFVKRYNKYGVAYFEYVGEFTLARNGNIYL